VISGVALGALLLIWPALLNGYPLLFSDTGAFMAQTIVPLMVWDKPYVYGPFLHLFHWRISLWGPLLAQGLIVSHLLWLVMRAVWPEARWWAHPALCAGLAQGTGLPWVVSLLMPDIFAPVLVLCVFLLGFTAPRGWLLGWLVLLGGFAAAVHLSHLPLAAGLIVLVGLVARRWTALARAAAPLLLAVLALLGTNLVGNGRLSVSPYGSVFALARLVADGPAARVIEDECAAGRSLHMCAWVGRFPTDSDDFLWRGDGPVWEPRRDGARPGGPISLAPEAAEIVGLTLRRHPLEVAWLALGNAVTQMGKSRIGDALVPDWLDDTVGLRLRQGDFPPAEQERFHHSLQFQGRLVSPLAVLHGSVLILATPFALLAWWRAHRAGDRLRLGLTICCLAALLGNAIVTGALSKPHHRYQARVIWLLPLVAVLGWQPPRPGRDVLPG
jgi:hypothetical protein